MVEKEGKEYEISYDDIKIDEEHRKYLEERVEKEGLQSLYEEAKNIDFEEMK